RRLFERPREVAQRSTRIGLDRRAMRYEDAPQRLDTGPREKLCPQGLRVRYDGLSHDPGDLRFLAGEPGDTEQPAAKTGRVVDVADDVVDDEGRAACRLDQ